MRVTCEGLNRLTLNESHHIILVYSRYFPIHPFIPIFPTRFWHEVYPLLISPSLYIIFIIEMQIIAAYLLAVLGGNQKPTYEDLEKIGASVEIVFDKAQAEAFIAKAADKVCEITKINPTRHHFTPIFRCP